MRINEKTLVINGVNHAQLIKKLLLGNVILFSAKQISPASLTIKISRKSFSSCKTVLKKYGYTYSVASCVSHWIGICVGALCSILFLFVMSQFCWQIEVKSDNYELNEQVRQILEKNSCCVGKMWNEIDFLVLTSEIQAKCDNIGLISFSRQGGTLVANLSKFTPPIEIAPTNTTGVFASADGIVSRIFVESGTPLVKVGDTVHVGQMLIAPYNFIEDNTVACEAKGKVFLYVWNSATVEFREKQKSYVRTGRKSVAMSIVWHNKNILEKDNNSFEYYESESVEKYLVALPIKIVYTTFYELEFIEINLKFTDEKESLIFQAREKVLTIVDESDIMEEKITIDLVDQTYYVTCYVKTEIEV